MANKTISITQIKRITQLNANSGESEHFLFSVEPVPIYRKDS